LRRRRIRASPVPSSRSAAREDLEVERSPTFQTDSQGAVRYVENQRIRSAIVAANHTVYDVRCRTNRLGFIDHEDYVVGPSGRSSDARRYAFVGDSLAAGMHGGTPWVVALVCDLPFRAAIARCRPSRSVADQQRSGREGRRRWRARARARGCLHSLAGESAREDARTLARAGSQPLREPRGPGSDQEFRLHPRCSPKAG